MYRNGQYTSQLRQYKCYIFCFFLPGGQAAISWQFMTNGKNYYKTRHPMAICYCASLSLKKATEILDVRVAHCAQNSTDTGRMKIGIVLDTSTGSKLWWCMGHAAQWNASHIWYLRTNCTIGVPKMHLHSSIICDTELQKFICCGVYVTTLAL